MQKLDSNGGSLSGQRFWFAVSVRERYEQPIAEALAAKNIEAFSPMVTVRRQWCDRVKTMETPLFPGYIFCRIDPAYRMPVLIIPGVHYFVGIGHVPYPVPDAEIESIQTLVRSGLPALSRPYLAKGDRVRVWEGPLRGVEGVLLEARNGLELVVSISLLQRSVAVVVNAAWVLPADAEVVYVSAKPALAGGARGSRI